MNEDISVFADALALPDSLALGLAALKRTLPLDGIFCNVYDPAGACVRFLAHADHAGAHAPDLTVQVDRALAAKRHPSRLPAYRIDDIEADPFTKAVGTKLVPGMRSFVMVRLALNVRRCGIVCFYSLRRAAFTDDDVKRLAGARKVLSLLAAFAIVGRLSQANRALEAANRRLLARIGEADEAPLAAWLAGSPSLASLAPRVRRMAALNATVLITGESGTGKEVFARLVHEMSPRRRAPFVAVNCATLSDGLGESELFGHEKGAYTGAGASKGGLFEAAAGGTLFLDEVGELSASMQAALLRVLQEKRVRRVGATEERGVDVRIMAATNRRLEDEVAAGRFRLDLYYRLNVFDVELPPLRERANDLAPLAERFLTELAAEYGLSNVPVLSDVALAQAKAYAWPGNVREWRNVLARASLTAGEAIDALPLPGAAGAAGAPERDHAQAWSEFDFATVQRRYFAAVLRACDGRISGAGGAAERTGLHPNTLRSRLTKLGVPFGGQLR